MTCRCCRSSCFSSSTSSPSVHHLVSSYHCCCHVFRKSAGFLGFPSLKTIVGRFLIEKDAAASNTGSNSFPRSVISYSTLTGYSDTILLLTIPNLCSSRSRSVRTYGVMPSIFSRKRLNCFVPRSISLTIRMVHFFPIILKVASIGQDLSSGLL